MINKGFDSRVKIQEIIDSQIPEFILDENPKFSEFLKQYYISQEYQGGSVDISDNLDQYLKLDNLTPEIISDSISLSSDIDSTQTEVTVSSTKGFPKKYGLLKINDEIITYTGISNNTFTGCIRGFSGVTSHHQDLNSEELVFSTSFASEHSTGASVQNLSSLFLKEFYKNIKSYLTPGIESRDFVSDLNAGNFIKESKSLYQSKGTEESFRILFNVLFGETPKVIDLEKFLSKPSSASFLRRDVVIAEAISGNPLNLAGQTIFKNNDEKTSASISEVETITRKGKRYYKLLLFVGFDDSFPPTTGNFKITGSSKNIEKVSVGSSIITVDTTIGFPSSGTLISGNNVISYGSKSVNQFLDCSGVNYEIPSASTISSDENYFGYEDGDISKKVELRVTGVISGFKKGSKTSISEVGEKFSVKNVGEKINNPENINEKSYKQIFANSWIYNTSSRYFIDNENTIFDTPTSEVFLKSSIDKSSLKLNDRVDVLERGESSLTIAEDLTVDIISGQQITLSDSFTLDSSKKYDIRRRVNFAQSNSVDFEYDSIISDVQNVYNENDEYMYVASNSLPSYSIEKSIFSYNASGLSNLNSNTAKYSNITFSSKVSFVTGDEIYYSYTGSNIPELEEGVYYVEVLPGNFEIRLYFARSIVGTLNYITFSEFPTGTHNFILYSQIYKKISGQKLLRKFPLQVNNGDGESDITSPGGVGLLINGVEIESYKSDDKIYYGPIEKVRVLNGGSDYDVINPPLLQISSGSALLQPNIKGSLKKILIDPQEFDIDVIVSVALTGGNGRGASFDPVIERKRREIKFDARQLTDGGGIDITNETITFLTPHGLINGESITYRPSSNTYLGIGTFEGTNEVTGNTLLKDANYFVKFISDTTIQLYQSKSDYNLGINTVGFTTAGTSGVHKFATQSKNTLSEIRVLNSGENYENRKLRVKPSGISTFFNTINFKNHGFEDGQVVEYSNTVSLASTIANKINGISTDNKYYILKVDDDSFKLADAGIGATSPDNYQRRVPVGLGTTAGEGYHVFSFPEINLKVEYSSVGLGSTQFKGTINATPIIRGSIQDVYAYETGSDYGSSILNYENSPTISIKNGKNASLLPVIVSGEIKSVSILGGGSEYYSIPDLVVNGTGSGASLKAVLTNNKISDVVIINPGTGYSSSNTTITVNSSGKGALFGVDVRSLTVNKNLKFTDINDNFYESNELILKADNGLKYSISGYTDSLKEQFSDTNSSIHSPIIGWAYDGNPIYGSFGYSDPLDKTSDVKSITPGYTKSLTHVENRPSGFELGFFIEDYKFTNSGDLDEYNGRFCVTEEFPNGTYAYFATSIENAEGVFDGVFPYFIGDRYRSKLLIENKTLDQDFDFNSSNLIRNTFPYKVGDVNADYDFIVESNELINQELVVESVSFGPLEDFEIIESGINYSVNDVLNFDESETSGGGLIVRVSKIKGKEIDNLQTSYVTYEDSIFVRRKNEIDVFVLPRHEFNDLDYVNISGFSTNFSYLNGNYQIGVTTYLSTITVDIPTTVGVITDIYVSNIPKNISIGSSAEIGSEVFKILNIFDRNNIIRVQRSSVGTSHTATSRINFIPNKFTFTKVGDDFDSKVNDVVYFNPKESVGVGTTSGLTTSATFNIGIQTNNTISIPTQSIFLPGHPFKTNQGIFFNKPASAASISVANTSTSTPFDLPGVGTTIFVIKKSADHIGLVTEVGLTTNTNGLYFINNADDNSQYYFESDFTQITGDIKKITTKVTLSTTHTLKTDDIISLTVNPSLNVGIGTSTKVNIFKNFNNTISVGKNYFRLYDISTDNKNYRFESSVKHNFKTGDRVIYNSAIYPTSILKKANGEEMENSSFYVKVIDDYNVILVESYSDLSKNSISGESSLNLYSPSVSSHVGSYYSILALVNPKIEVVKNNDLVFDLTDSSLTGYNLKIFYDKDFKDEFISTGSTSIFSVSGVGTAGVSTNASLTLNYGANIPEKLYYALEKSGSISTVDKEVSNYSEISFVNSHYKGSYKVTSVGSTTFDISLTKDPERDSYSKSECDSLKYDTSSLNDTGGVSKLAVLSFGDNYTKIPEFIDITSTNGSGAYVIAKSNTIGKINQVRIINEGFEYSSDKTLSPETSISNSIVLEDSNQISSIDVLSGGQNYTSAPDLIIIDPETREVFSQGILKANLSGNSIESVEVEQSPKGIPFRADVKAVNNTNGIGIQTFSVSSGTVITCKLITPSAGFGALSPFSIGDKIFVEGFEKEGSDGSGFNSEDYGYEFFTVTNFSSGGPGVAAELEYNLTGFTTNAGVAKTVSNSYASIVNFNKYPQFLSNLEFSKFIINEKLQVKVESNFIESDLKVTEIGDNFIKVSGSYYLKTSDKIRGTISGSIATINEINSYQGNLIIDSKSRRDYGWSDDIGKLNQDTQVIADNDYYQNLSYSVKTKKTWDDISSPVNKILHTAGMKNFADTEIINSVGITTKPVSDRFDSYITELVDISSENRVDTINYFDLVKDIEIFSSSNKSKFIKLNNKKLTDYIKSVTNRVLKIDDISEFFSSSESDLDIFTRIEEIPASRDYTRYLVQVTNNDFTQVQLEELVVLNDDARNTYLLEKASISNTIGFGITTSDYVNTENRLGNFEVIEELGAVYLKFSPIDEYNTDYKVKFISNKFSNFAGVGTTSIGSIDITSTSHAVGSGLTQTLSQTSGKTAIYSQVYLTDNVTLEMNYVEIYVDYDGTDVNFTELFMDSDEDNFSANPIGLFTSYVDGGGILKLDCENLSNNSITLQSRNIEFASVGIASTYRFKALNQPDESERTILYEAKDISSSSSEIEINSLNINLFSSLKSTIRVDDGSSSALHQVMFIHDTNNVYTVQYPFISIGSTTGIGTFGGEISGSEAKLKFYPDSAGTFNLLSFNEKFYSFTDLNSLNSPLPLKYGDNNQIEDSNYVVTQYLSKGSQDVFNFKLNYETTPIFMKVFDPTNTTVLDPTTSEFTIPNHFFNTGEELTYRYKSSFIGVTPSSILSGGVGIGSTVYAIKTSNSTFKLAASKSDADSGTSISFSSVGSGNAHELEMVKKNEKALIVVDNLVQAPISYALLSYTIDNGGSDINSGVTTIALSGISSIFPKDILKIDDEYVKVENVGFGTSISGPISFAGSFPLVEVERGFVGSSATSHSDGSVVDLYRGSFNIVGDEIWFTEPPRGVLEEQAFIDDDNLPEPVSSFSGRVFLKKDYSNNQIFDNISDNFTGIGQTYEMTVGGASTSGIGSDGSRSIVFLNGIFQSPTTNNNPNGNFELQNDSNAGITTIIFSGITSANGSIITSESDVNVNEVPRGGLIVSLGSTPGLGYAPLVGASVRPIIGAGGAISDIVVGLGTTSEIKSISNPYSISTASYDNVTGVLEVTTVNPHNFGGSDLQVYLENLEFSCDSSHLGVTTTIFPDGSSPYGTKFPVIGITSENTFSVRVGTSTITHNYVGMGSAYRWYNLNSGSGYRNSVSIGITDLGETPGSGAVITASVGAGGTLSFAVSSPGSGYSTETTFIEVPAPSYDNLEVTGVSRRGIGSTTDTGIGLLLNVEVGASSTTGIGSTLFQISNFNITRSGYGFKPGDVITPVGLVTAAGLSEPIEQFQLTVLDTFSDQFFAWDFGELDYIDSIKSLQDGTRKLFPLYYQNQLLSFDIDLSDSDSQLIDVDALLIIFVNGVLQEPGSSYVFNGGTSFTFTSAPKENDDVRIYFYRGSSNDSGLININETIEIGDEVRIIKNNNLLGLTTSQDNSRTISNIVYSDQIETVLYGGSGIDDINLKPLSWSKQKRDKIIDGVYQYKTRDILEPQVYPTSKIIKSITSGDTTIYVDSVDLFNYETPSSFDASIISGDPDPVSAAVTAIVSSSGTIQSLSITNPGSGYTGSSISAKISAPSKIGVGIGTTATATITVSGGFLTTPITITNPGLGYSQTNPPQVLVAQPAPMHESLTNINTFQYNSGNITEIGTRSGFGGASLGVYFVLDDVTNLSTGDYIHISGTSVGNGVTSVIISDSNIIGLGTTCVDNIYRISDVNLGINSITCNILSTTDTTGIQTSGNYSGKFSWGRLSSVTRSTTNPISLDISGYQVDVGLTTFPTIQRRSEGLRNTGALS